jgi:hypothetical protein
LKKWFLPNFSSYFAFVATALMMTMTSVRKRILLEMEMNQLVIKIIGKLVIFLSISNEMERVCLRRLRRGATAATMLIKC